MVNDPRLLGNKKEERMRLRGKNDKWYKTKQTTTAACAKEESGLNGF